MNTLVRGKKGTIQLRRRVPKRYTSVEERGTIWVSLHTDSPEEARRKGDAVWNEQIAAWEAMLAGDPSQAEARLAAAMALAAVRGFSYRPMAKLIEGPVEELLKRVEAIPIRKGKPDLKTAAAVLGTVPDPGLPIS